METCLMSAHVNSVRPKRAGPGTSTQTPAKKTHRHHRMARAAQAQLRNQAKANLRRPMDQLGAKCAPHSAVMLVVKDPRQPLRMAKSVPLPTYTTATINAPRQNSVTTTYLLRAHRHQSTKTSPCCYRNARKMKFSGLAPHVPANTRYHASESQYHHSASHSSFPL